MIVVQHIETIWTKKSRGMPDAAKRNMVPRKLEIPTGKSISNGIFIHEVTARECDKFSLEQKTKIIEKSDKYWTLMFREEKDKVQILFTYDYYKHGQPNRGAFRRPLFKLSSGEWGSLHINGRFTSYSGQYYLQHFVNVGNVSKINPNLFLESEPNYYIDKMAHLF